MTRKIFVSALLFGALLGCGNLTERLGLKRCVETSNTCEGTVLTVCQEGAPEVRVECGPDLLCNAELGQCDLCGNGIVDPGEQCDPLNDLDCLVSCQLAAICGDGEVGQGETCDDGNTASGDGCRADCKGEEACGDGLVDVDAGEVCDDGNNAPSDGCRSDCAGFEVCGDGLVDVDAGEVCDDNNNAPNDGCRSDCAGLELCGDALFDPAAGEVCDDGNRAAGDGCRANCDGVESCGDGLVDPFAAGQPNEQCDDGNNLNADGCQANCKNPRCGDVIVDAGEQCDDGNNNNLDSCTNACQNARCGDLLIQVGEQCDDGNNNNLDGCNNACQSIVCGNGVAEGSEECDDSNSTNGDGCNAACNFENVSVINCDSGNVNLDEAITNAAANATIKLSGNCNSADINASATINNNIVIVGQGNAKIETSLGGAILNINVGSVALVNLEIINTSNGGGARTISCIGNTKVLLDRLTIRNQAGDRGISVANNCNMIIANTVITGSTSSNKDTIEMKDSPKLDIIFSTFFDNQDSSEEGIVDIEGQCRFDSVVGFANGVNPVNGGAPTGLNPANDTFSFIQDETFSGTQNVDPRITAGTFRLQSNSPAINEGNPILDVTRLNFNPVLEFGLNPYVHDRLNAPRVKNGRADAGAFEDF